jgi:arylformamidase
MRVPNLIDLSHTIENGLITYKGLPPPIICDYLTREDSKNLYEAGTSFQIGKIDMVTNTGTYMDSPFHRFENGKDLSEVSLEKFVGLEGVLIVIDHHKTLAVTVDHVRNLDLKNKAVLFCTGWHAYWNTEKYFTQHPYLTKETAEYLREQQVVLVGIDSHNIDDTSENSRPVHSILLGAEILIVEHLCNLELLKSKDFSFTAAPPKFKGVGTFPVRAFATIHQS